MWTKLKILKLIETNDTMVERSLFILYQRQTRDEKINGETKHNNKMGFNGADAPILTSFVVQMKTNKYNNPEGKRLSQKQKIVARRRLRKYAQQLATYANTQQELKIQKALGTEKSCAHDLFTKGGTFGEA